MGSIPIEKVSQTKVLRIELDGGAAASAATQNLYEEFTRLAETRLAETRLAQSRLNYLKLT